MQLCGTHAMLAFCQHERQITVRDVPEKVRDELAARAAIPASQCRKLCVPNSNVWRRALR